MEGSATRRLYRRETTKGPPREERALRAGAGGSPCGAPRENRIGAQRRTGCQVITEPIVVAVEPLSSAKPSASCELRRLATSIAERVSASSVAVKAATLRPSEEKTELVAELSATSLSLWAGPGPIFFTQRPWSRRKSSIPAAGASSSTKEEPAPATCTRTLLPLA